MSDIKSIFTLIILLSISSAIYADNFYTLYGIKIGQKISVVKQHFGKPDKVINFEDGWKAYAYFRKGHNVIFEANQSRPDLVISIQMEGNENPKGMGVDYINLGDNAKKIIKKLGKPSKRQVAKDLFTKKVIPNTFINFYGNNLSFEEKNNKITSIKINFDAVRNYSTTPDFDAFLKNIKSRNYYKISESLSTSMTLKGKKAIKSPIISQVTGKSALNTFLFGKDGLMSITPKDISDVNLRVIAADREKNTPGSTGSVFKFKNKKINELYFVKSYEGWVLYDAW